MMGIFDRAADRLMAAPRVGPGEAGLTSALDALGGEVVRLRSRDGLRLAGRWLEVLGSSGEWLAGASPSTSDGTASDLGERVPGAVQGGRSEGAASAVADPADDWVADPHEAILLLHGYSGSIAPDVVEYGPFLRRVAGVLGLDFRGHGGSDAGPTTFGALEVEDVAGALAWLGERGITRVALVGTSMGAIAAIEAVAILGDGRLTQADIDPFSPKSPSPPPRPYVVGIVADSATPELAIPVGASLGVPVIGRWLAGRLFAAIGRRIGADPRATEPGRVMALVDPTPILLVHGAADRAIPVSAARRLAALAGSDCELWVVPGAGHSAAHRTERADYETRVGAFLRRAFAEARGLPPIIPGREDSRPADAGV